MSEEELHKDMVENLEEDENVPCEDPDMHRKYHIRIFLLLLLIVLVVALIIYLWLTCPCNTDIPIFNQCFVDGTY